MLLLLLWVGVGVPVALIAETMPVFKLAPVTPDPGRANEILGKMGAGPPESKDRPDAYVQHVGGKEVEVLKASGAIFLRDKEKLWNPKARPKGLPSQEKAKGIADQFLADHKMLPAKSPNVKVSFKGFGQTVTMDAGKEKVQLDHQVNYQVELAVKRGGQEVSVPVVGGGGKFQVTVGDNGEVIGASGGWRAISGGGQPEEILSKEAAMAKFKEKMGDLKITKTEATLGYYSAPAFEEQSVLPPVWVISGEAEIGGEKVPLRNTIVAATKHGPHRPDVPPGLRKKDQKAKPEALNPDEGKEGASHEAGTYWIGPSQGLSGSPANAQGFVDGLAAAGWSINFNWGESNAWEQDWTTNDNTWVDSADAVFYTGHASPNGWVLNPPNDTFLNFSEVGGGRWGDSDLEWVIIAACGPLQSSHFTSNVSNAFDRWRNAFQGLHILLGYGAVTFDNTTEGARFVQLARAGWSVIDAWFRTAQEIQPSTNGYPAPNGPNIYVVAMYAHDGSYNMRYDHLWGMGTTYPDPPAAGAGQVRTIMWSGT